MTHWWANDMDDERPVVHCLVGWELPNQEHIVRLVTLEQAADFQRFGWRVLVDPAEHAELVRWEQLHRSWQFFRKGPK